MLRILIADDAPQVRKSLKSLLESHKGWTICGEAANGEDAVKKALALVPDVILLDVSMPILNGLEAAAQIKQSMPSAIIYIVTQHHSLEMARVAAEAGARGFIAKIRVAADLIPAIESATAHLTPIEIKR
jgi:two-component system nitrate/nitrite response regulator NarL